MTSMIQQLHQHEATQASVALTAPARRQIVAHIGCAENHHTFAWASHETINDAPSAKIVLSLCADLPPLHQEAMRLADEVLVLNLAGHIDARTLHELCAAHNVGKPITWLEDWPMYCPACRCSGPEAEHFFHTTLSLHDLNDLFETLTASQLAHLDGQLADWYGQIVPVILLPDGYPALQVDLTCSSCDHFARTAYAIAGEYGAWATLLAADGAFLADFCDADARTQALVCTECAAQVAARRALPPVRVIGDGLQQHATQYYHRAYSLT